MFLLLVYPQGGNRRKYEVTICFRTRDLEFLLPLIACAFLCFLFLFDLLAVNHLYLSCVLGFTATFFCRLLFVTVYITSKFLLVFQELFFCLETLTAFTTLVGVDVFSHYRALGVHCDAMVAKSRRAGEQGTTVSTGTPSLYALMSSVFCQLREIKQSAQTINHHFDQFSGIVCYLLCSYLSECKEAILAIRAAEGLLLCAVAGLVLAELLGGREALVTLVTREECISLQNHEQKSS